MQLKVASNLEHTNQHANFKTEVFKIIKKNYKTNIFLSLQKTGFKLDYIRALQTELNISEA